MTESLTTAELALTDAAGDTLHALPHSTNADKMVLRVTEGTRAATLWPDRQQVAELVDYLTHWLEADDPTEGETDDRPDAEADGYGWGIEAETILEEAQRAVYGDRQGDYGHPREDFTRTAILWTGLLHHKLADGVHLEPEDIGRCMIAVKLSRDVNSPKRDNRVDMAGYALTLDRLETGQ